MSNALFRRMTFRHNRASLKTLHSNDPSSLDIVTATFKAAINVRPDSPQEKEYMSIVLKHMNSLPKAAQFDAAVFVERHSMIPTPSHLQALEKLITLGRLQEALDSKGRGSLKESLLSVSDIYFEDRLLSVSDPYLKNSVLRALGQPGQAGASDDLKGKLLRALGPQVPAGAARTALTRFVRKFQL